MINTPKRAKELEKAVARIEGRTEAAIERLSAVNELEDVKRELLEAKLQLDRLKEDHEREKREIEHKLGLHKIQVEQERTSAVKEAELKVREEALAAQKDRAEEQIQFIQQRMEQEMQAHRTILNSMMDRLPRFEHSRVEHIGVDPNPPKRLEITGESQA